MLKTKASTHQLDEQSRQEAHGIAKSYFKTRTKLGKVSEIDEKLYAVTVQLDEGGFANGGDFIPIINPWLEMIHQFGPLRKNLRVVIEYEGDQDNNPTARVIGLEDEPIAQKQESAEKKTALYEIFFPG